MNDVAHMPMTLAQVARLAAQRTRNGEDVEIVVDDILTSGVGKRLPRADREWILKSGIFEHLAECIATFLDADRAAFIEHVRASYPEFVKFLLPVVEQTNGAELLAGIVAVQMEAEARP